MSGGVLALLLALAGMKRMGRAINASHFARTASCVAIMLFLKSIAAAAHDGRQSNLPSPPPTHANKRTIAPPHEVADGLGKVPSGHMIRSSLRSVRMTHLDSSHLPLRAR